MTAVQYSTVQYSTVQCSTPLYSTEQCSTVQCSTLTYSTVQYTNLQYSAVQWNKYVFIQFLPYPPPSLPDTLRHPAIHLLPPHNNCVAVRNVVLSVRPSVRPSLTMLPLCDILKEGDRNIFWLYEKPTGHYIYKHSSILHSAQTLYLCVLCGSENKQRLLPYTALNYWFL